MLLFKFRKRMPNYFTPNNSSRWDATLQLWVDKDNGTPEVLKFKSKTNTKYGETSLTESGEGVDQSDISLATEYGETTFTKTQEGIDQSESNSFVFSSRVGETVITNTNEGIDQSESAEHAFNNYK